MQIFDRLFNLKNWLRTRKLPEADTERKTLHEEDAAIRRLSEHLQTDLSVFFVNSANFWRYPELTYSAANNFPRQVLGILAAHSGVKLPQAIEAAAFSKGADDSELARLFIAYGSDKTAHGYAPIYTRLLTYINSRTSPALLEIGLGTTAPKAISTMGKKGKPGASLRAFRDFMPEARIYGADVDASALFQEKRVRTALVDQLRPKSFGKMTAELGCAEFDIIIDDGLHSTEANLNTLSFALEALKPGGWLIIEDIPPRTLDAWLLFTAIHASDRIDYTLVRTKTQFMLLARRASEGSRL